MTTTSEKRSALLVASPLMKRRSALVRALERAGLRVVTPDRTGQTAAPDLVVVLGAHSALLTEVKLMRAVAPNVPIFVVWVNRPEERSVTEAYAAGATSVVPAGQVDVAWSNLLRVLTGARRGGGVVSGHVVPSFHGKDGRLDARRVASTMGLTLSQVAKAIGVTVSALSKRPNAGVAQPGLRELEFSWSVLVEMLGETDLARVWLHAGHPDFSGQAPLVYLTEGGAKRLGDYLRAALAGEAA